MSNNNEDINNNEIDSKWSDLYLNTIDKINISNTHAQKIIKYTKLLSTKYDDTIIENKINEIEKDYDQKLKYVESLYNDRTNIDLIKSKNSLYILQKELEIIKILTKYTLQNKFLNYTFFKSSLLLLLELSEVLRLRLHQKEITHSISDKSKLYNESLYRCSYKFCSYHSNCVYNYNKTKNLCYQDHYVHNMISADIKILIIYIDKKVVDTDTICHTKEILKTINTLSYAICHMENELKAKCMHLLENEWEKMHIINNQ